MSDQKQTAGIALTIPAAAKYGKFIISPEQSLQHNQAAGNTLQGDILGILHAAYPERVHMRDLAEVLGMTTRQVRKEVELLRRAGYPICSSQSGYDGGYWLSSGDLDLKAYQARAKRTAANRLKLINQMRKAAAEQQPSLFDAAGGIE